MSFSFTTTASYEATVGNNTLADALPNFSISYWIKSSSTQSTGIFLASKESAGVNAGWQLLIIPSAGLVNFALDSGGYNRNATANFYDGNWHSFIVCYDASAGVTGYLDGVPFTFGAGGGGLPSSNSQPLSINGLGGASLAGQFYDIRFYNITLTFAQAARIAAGGDIGPTNLQAEWPVSSSSGTVFADVTGNGNTLTYNLSPTPFSSTDIPPVFLNAAGKSSMFLVF